MPGTGSPVGPSLSSQTGTPPHGRMSPRTHPDNDMTKHIVITSYTIHILLVSISFLRHVKIFSKNYITKLGKNTFKIPSQNKEQILQPN